MKKEFFGVLSTLFIVNLTMAGTVQFGGVANWLNNATYKNKIGASEIIQWNGADIAGKGKNYKANGTLIKQGVGGMITAPQHGVTLTTRLVSSNVEGADKIINAQLAVGIDPKRKWGALKETRMDAIGFDFDKDVSLQKFIFVGIKKKEKDSIKITVEDLYEKTITQEDMEGTYAWSKNYNIKSFTLGKPLPLPKGTIVTIEASGSEAPQQNSFGLGGVIVSVEGKASSAANKK